MRFIDQVEITASSGKGGDGCTSFRREKFVPKGGANGGNGGAGGSIFIQATKDLNTLIHFRGINEYKAQEGGAGSSSHRDGKAGEDLVLKVPVGTIIRLSENDQVITDLKEDQQRVLILKGGRGGLGNMNFKSSTNRTPRHSQKGGSSEKRELFMELKLLADIALVGTPNAGKSTLLSTISAARPKIADYPFTTLKPQLGVVKLDQQSLVVADIPGLVEKAHLGRGLGSQFLKHIERTKALVHLVDISDTQEEYDAFDNYVSIRNELSQYGYDLENKRELVCLTKIDAITDERVERYQQFFNRQLQKKVLPISSVSGKNIKKLKEFMIKMIIE